MPNDKEKKARDKTQKQDVQPEAQEEGLKQGQEDTQTAREEAQGQEGQVPLSDQELLALCKERICPDCPQFKTARDEKLRALAEAENYKRRITREKDDLVKFASEKVLEEIVPIIDNLELALQHGREVEGCQDLVQGVEMTYKLFLETLAKHGLTQVGQQGEGFDPNIHEAVAEEARQDIKEGHVCQVMQRGYSLKGRLLRPAKVVVSKKEKN